MVKTESQLYSRCQSSRDLNDFEEYLLTYPTGEHVEHIRGWFPGVLNEYLSNCPLSGKAAECKKYKHRLDTLRKSDPEHLTYWNNLISIVADEAKTAHSAYVKDLKSKKGTLKAQEYAKMFDLELLTDQDLSEIGVTRDDVECLKNTKGTIQIDIDPLEEERYKNNEYQLPEGNTEIYFWGMPGSGKSCCLAALLSTATIEGNCAGFTPGCTGNQYFEKLKNIFGEDGSFSTLIRGTNENSIAFAECKMIKKEYGTRKMCLIDLAGETFKSMHACNNKQPIDETRQLCLDVTTSYLNDTRNRKLHFFIVPYIEPGKDKLYDGISTRDYLQAGAHYLLEHKIIKNSTDGIYIIVTKSDLLKCPSEKYEEEAEKYIRNRYSAFINHLEAICEDNGIGTSSRRVEVLSFSIGDMLSPEVCKYNAKGAQRLIDILCKKSKKDSSGFAKVLGTIFGL